MSQDYPKHTDPDFTPLDASELNDLRRRVVNNKEVTDEELQYAIQTLLYANREKAVPKKAPRKSSRSSAPPPDISFDDLLNSPVNPTGE